MINPVLAYLFIKELTKDNEDTRTASGDYIIIPWWALVSVIGIAFSFLVAIIIIACK